MLHCQSSLLGFQFRDISDYKRAFTDARKDTNGRPESRPDRRPWLEAHLDSQGSIRPSSEPVQSLLHWGESRPDCRAPGHLMAMDGDTSADRQFDDDNSSPYLSEFRHSQSLDFAVFGELDDL
jgi:hypothetical protein